MLKGERKHEKKARPYCQRCAQEIAKEIFIVKHEASGCDLKICGHCRSDLIFEKEHATNPPPKPQLAF